MLMFAALSAAGAVAAAETLRRPQQISVKNSIQRYVYPDPDIPTLKDMLRSGEGAQSPEARFELRLWHLLSAGQVALLRKTIAKRQAETPGWQPPNRLRTELARAELRTQIDAARSHPAELLALFRRHPEAFNCREYYNLWSLADAHRTLGDGRVTAEVYRQILADCRQTKVLLATLDRVAAEEGAATAIAQASALKQRPEITLPAGALSDRLYHWRLQQGAALRRQNRKPQALAMLEPLAGEIQRRRDLDAVRLLGWSYHDNGDTQQAIAWFERVAAWSGTEADRVVVLQARFNAGEHAPVIAWLHGDTLAAPAARHWAADVLRGEAARRYAQQDYQATLKLLADAARYDGSRSADGAMLAGWSNYKLGRYQQAQQAFANVYRTSAVLSQREAAAEGVLLCAQQDGDWNAVRDLATRSKGVLLSEAGERRLVEALQRGELGAADVDVVDGHLRRQYGNAASIVAAGGGWTERRGGSGLDRYTLWRRPLAHWQLSGGGGFRFYGRIDDYALDSEAPAAGSWLGSGRWQVNTPTQTASFSAHGTGELLVGLRRADNPLFLELGRSADGGAIAPTWLGRLGYDRRGAEQGLVAALYRRPRQDSLLSYVGMNDPFSGKRWGRVVEQGVAIDGYRSIDRDWHVGGHLALFDLEGASVAGNSGNEFYLAVQRTIEASGSRNRLGLGPYLYATGYAKDLSHYSFGQGGYYSPQRMWQTGLSGDWLCNGTDSVLHVAADIGYQNQRNSASAVFPLGGASGRFGAGSSSGVAGRLMLSWVQRLGTTAWQWAGLLSVTEGPAFGQNEQWLFLRYRFGRGTGVRTEDLPERWNPELPGRY